jgi:hypothetical protein
MTPFRPIPEATPRKAMTTKRKLAACLAHMRDPSDPSRPLVPGADKMTDDQIIAAVQFDHEIPLEIGGKDEAHNIRPLTILHHITVKTPLDQKIIAKARHNRDREKEFRDRVLAKTIGDDQPRDVRRNRIPNRPFQKGHRPMRARVSP